MTVRITKPEFNLREKISELDRPTGLKGSELIKSDTLQDARNSINAGRKNLIINGNPLIYQRAKSVSPAVTYSYNTADRWRISANNSQTDRVTEMSVETNADIGGDFIGNYVRINHTTAASSPHAEASYGYNYRIEPEDIIPYLGKEMVLSFYARSNVGIAINSGFFSGTTASSIKLADPADSSTFIRLDSNWKRYECPFTVGTTIPTSFVDVGLRHQVHKVGYVDMSGVQLELGGRATEFEHRSFNEELALCQRYFQSNFPIIHVSGMTSFVAPQNGYYNANSGLAAGFNGAVCFSSNNLRSPHIMFHPQMREQPDVTLYSTSNNDDDGKWAAYDHTGGWSSGSTNQIDYFGNRGFGVRYAAGGISADIGEAYLYRGSWEADAEL